MDKNYFEAVKAARELDNEGLVKLQSYLKALLADRVEEFYYILRDGTPVRSMPDSMKFPNIPTDEQITEAHNQR